VRLEPLSLVAVAVAALIAAGCGAARVDPAAVSHGGLTLEQARAFDDFPLLYAGEQVDGLPLRAIVRRDDTASYVAFVYGDCEPAADDLGCAPPTEVQVWPACARSLDLYGNGPGSPTVEPTVVRGVSALALDGGTQLELQTGRSTVVVFASTPARADRVARALRPVGAGSSSGSLPQALDDPC
jgi:hypothetical protein